MMEYKSLKGVEEFMPERDLVPEAHRSFYVNWVRRVLNSCGRFLSIRKRIPALAP